MNMREKDQLGLKGKVAKMVGNQLDRMAVGSRGDCWVLFLYEPETHPDIIAEMLKSNE